MTEKKGVNVRERQSDAVLQSVGESLLFFAAVHLNPHVWHFSFTLCPSLSHLLSSLSFLFSSSSSSSFSENSEICPDDKQRNKAKSDEVQRTCIRYNLLHTAVLLNWKTLFCLQSTPPQYPLSSPVTKTVTHTSKVNGLCPKTSKDVWVWTCKHT